jgi:hypothetical protein
VLSTWSVLFVSNLGVIFSEIIYWFISGVRGVRLSLSRTGMQIVHKGFLGVGHIMSALFRAARPDLQRQFDFLKRDYVLLF